MRASLVQQPENSVLIRLPRCAAQEVEAPVALGRRNDARVPRRTASGWEILVRLAPRAAVRLGDWSYSLYLTHLLSLVLLGKIWMMVGLSEAPAAMLIVSLIVFSLLIAGLTYDLIEKPLIGVAKRARNRLFTRGDA